MKKIKKSIMGLLITSALIMLLSVPVFAGNTTDTKYTFNFSANSNYTSARQKQDDSSCYMYYNNGTLSFTASVYGTYITGTNIPHYDCSNGYHYSFTSNHEKRFLYQYVHDDGNSYYPYASIRGEATGYGTCKGYWSPDSVYQATVLPASNYIP